MQGMENRNTAMGRRSVGRLRYRRIYCLHAIFSLLFYLAACASQEIQPALNSERIRQTFGNYGVTVLFNDECWRVSSLYSTEGNVRTARTYAVVEFADPATSALAAQHALIDSGESIGEVFRDAGWSIEKRHLFIGAIEVPAAYTEIAVLMRVALPQNLAIDVYYFTVNKGKRTYNYATITEIHHPDYLSAADLQGIYGAVSTDESSRESIEDFIGPPGISVITDYDDAKGTER